MALTVKQAFNTFLRETVNLNPEDSKKAKNSRQWLMGQLSSFPEKAEKFPYLYGNMEYYFGSFDRKTKTRPLDDVDLLLCFSAQGATYWEESPENISVSVRNDSYALKDLCSQGLDISSIKLINKIVSSLSKIDQYKSAEIKRNQEAATLNLSSYDWVFDIVPCFFTSPEFDGRTYFLIPDGKGNWKKTDPRKDKHRCTQINQKHNGTVLNVIRLMKYWNRKRRIPYAGSYLLENIVLDYYQQKSISSDSWPLEVHHLFNYLGSAIQGCVFDPKNIQGDLNKLDYLVRDSISRAAYEDYYRARTALEAEHNGDYRKSITVWKDIFGSDFPSYF